MYLIHASLLVGLTGYALATYEPGEFGPINATRAEAGLFDDYGLQLLGSRAVGFDARQGLPAEIHADFALLKEGTVIDRGTFVYWLVKDGTEGHYDARVTVIRRPLHDVYVYPATLHTDSGRLDDHVHGARPAGDDVHAVEFTVKLLPGVGLVWMGLWTITLAMGAQLVLGGFRIGEAEAAATVRSSTSVDVSNDAAGKWIRRRRILGVGQSCVRVVVIRVGEVEEREVGLPPETLRDA